MMELYSDFIITYSRVRARTSYLGSLRKNVPSRALCAWILNRDGAFTRRAEIRRSYGPSRDGTFLRAEPRWDVLTSRAAMGRTYALSRDGMFLRAEPRQDILTCLAEIGRSCSHPTISANKSRIWPIQAFEMKKPLPIYWHFAFSK